MTLPPSPNNDDEVHMVVDSCRPITNSSIYGPSDDPNANPFVGGVVGVGQNRLPETEWPDNCLGPTVLQEYHCQEVKSQNVNSSSEIRWTKRFFDCEYGCQELNGVGECLRSDSITCTDSDNDNFFSRGTVVWNDHPLHDSCRDPQNVREWVCPGDGEIPRLILHFCTHGCAEGACRRPSCLEQGVSISSEDEVCCGDLVPKEDLTNKKLATCCRQKDCAAGGDCYQEGRQIKTMECSRGTWQKNNRGSK